MVRRAWPLLLVGCNQIYDLDPTAVRTVDALEPCLAGSSFTSTIPVSIDGAYSVEAARFTSNRQLAYLSLCPTGVADPKPGCDIYTAIYANDQFTGFSRMAGVSASGFYDAYPTATFDNKHMLLGSTREGGVHIFIASTVNGSFDAATITRLPATSMTLANEPFIVNQRVLYFSAMANTNQLWRTEGDPPAFGDQPVLVPGVDLPGAQEFAPVVRDDELEMFFASGSQLAQLDIYTATRDSRSEPFRTPVRIAAASTAGIDWPVWISPDGCELYYINKANNVATLYVARR